MSEGPGRDGPAVFISYSRADSDWARRMRARLAEHGVASFLDRYGLPAGAPWQPQLEREIARASAMLVLCGAGGLGNWQQREIALALDRQANAGLPVLPVILPGNEEPPVGSFLALNTWVDLRRSPDDPEAWRGLLAGLRGEALDGRGAALAANINPYRGLLAFREQDAGLFFGREREVEALVGRVRAPSEHNLLGVIGRSGTGKSSVVFAGLVPALRRSRAGPVWDIVSLAPGAAPLAALARALDPAPEGASALEAAARAERGAALLREGTATLAQLVRERLARADERGTERLLLVVDQWEELYGAADRAEAARFAELVIEAGRRAPCTVVLTVRADFYDRLLESPGLRAALADALVPLGPMGRAELVRAIERPAEAVGFAVQRQLTARLLDDLGVPPEGEEGGYDAGRLPLLEFALERCWRAARAAGRTTLTAQDHADIGGLQGALEATAEEAFARLSPAGQDAARRLLVSLVSPREDGRDLRVRATVRDEPAAREALAAFSSREARLLAAEADAEGRVVAEVTHEALIRHWARLRGWVAANRRTLQRRDDVAKAAARWRESGGPDSHLLPPGVQLEVGKALMADHGDVLVDDLAPFVARSCEVDEAARRRERARRRRWSAALVALSLSSLGLAVYGWVAFQVARQAEATAVAALGDARRERHLALEQTWRALASLAGEYLRSGDAGTALLLALRAAPAPGEAERDDAALEDQTAGAIWNAMAQLRERLVAPAHAGGALALAMSRDGRAVATGGADGMVRVWRLPDADSGAPMAPPAPFRGHAGPVLAVALSPDGRTAASGGADGSIRLWSLRGGPPRLVAAAHGGAAVNALAFSPDGALLASTGDDSVVRVWRVADPDARRLVVTAHDGPGRSVAFSSDGQRVASASEDGAVRVASPEGNRPVVELRGHEGAVRAASFDPSGLLVATAGWDGTVRVFRLDEPFAPLLIGQHEGSVASAHFAAEGTRIVSAGEDGELRVWEVAVRAAFLSLRGHRGAATGAALSPDGARLASVGADGTLRLWRAGPEPSEPSVFREHAEPVQAVAFGAGGRLVASGAADGEILLRDLRAANGREEARRLGDEARAPVTGLAFDRAGDRLAAGGAEGVVRIWSLADPDAPPASFEAHPLAVHGVAFAPDGAFLATAGADGTVRLWFADGAARVLRVRAGMALRAVAVSPDARRIAAGAEDGAIHLWDVAGEGAPQVIDGGEAPVRSLDFAPDGSRLAVAVGRGRLRVLSLDGAAEPVELRGHVGEVASVAFGPLGRRVVSAGQDGTVRVWRADGTGVPWVQRSHDGSAHAVAISGDGRRLASGGRDRTLRVWNLGQGLAEMVARACAALPRELTAEQKAAFGLDPAADWPCAERARGLWPVAANAAGPSRP